MLNITSLSSDINDIVSHASEDIRDTIGVEVNLSLSIGKLDEKKIDFIIKLARLKEAICQASGISWKEIKSPTRKRPVVQARHFFSCYANWFLKMPSTKIGKLIGNRDHSTIINSWQTIKDLLSVRDESTVELNEKIKSLLYDESQNHSFSIDHFAECLQANFSRGDLSEASNNRGKTSDGSDECHLQEASENGHRQETEVQSQLL